MHVMSALSLVREYGSDSDSDTDDVSVSHSTDLDKCDNSKHTIEKIRLPVPKLIAEKSDNIEHVDNLQEHNGRLRSFPHERGNWSTYVYVPFTPNKKLFCFINLLLKNCSAITEFNVVDDFHISLSRTVVLKYHWIPIFTSSLQNIINDLYSFDIHFGSLNVYTNEEKTRTFIGLKVENDFTSYLKNTVTKIDKLLLEFNLKIFYTNPSFHVSLIWCLGDREKEIKDTITVLNFALQELQNCETRDESFSHLHIDRVCCKSGNKLYTYKLI